MLTYLILGIIAFAWLALSLGRASKWPIWPAPMLMGLAFLMSIVQWIMAPEPVANTLLSLSTEGYVLTALVSFISWIVLTYSLRHLAGNRNQRRTLQNLVAITFSLIVFVTANHTLVLAGSLLLSNVLLGRLVQHQGVWKAAGHSGKMIVGYLGAATLLLSGVALLLYVDQGTWLLSELNVVALGAHTISIAVALVVFAALLQSANLPLHGWLIASANAPTPVSAFMHAGLVNGGGIILYKFFPLLPLATWSFDLLFILGGLTARLGTAWMLVQPDIKRTLTCSTVGQMGFMIMQCGLGLFPAALAHMIWHGLFKASLFLGAGGAIKAPTNQSLRLTGSMALPTLSAGLLIGTVGAWIFAQFTGEIGPLDSTYSLLLIFCGITWDNCVRRSSRGKSARKPVSRPSKRYCLR